MIALSLLAFMIALDSCIIVTALHAIAIDLNLTANESFWVGTSFLLSNAVTMPLISGASNLFGRVRSLVASVALFTLGTAFCCLAHSSPTLLIGRIFQGIGAGGIMTLTLMIYADIVPLRERPKWYGIVLASWAGGNCIGPKTTWRWIFYVMFPFCISGIMATFLFFSRESTQRSEEQGPGLDWIGGSFFTSSATLFLISISWGGVQFEWDSAGTLAPLCLGSVGLIGTWFYERHWAENPMLQHRLFSSASQISAYICGSLQGLVLYGQLYYIPFYFTSVKAYSPLETGAATLPVMLITVPSSIVAGGFVTRTKNYRSPIWLGWMLIATGSGLTLLFDRNIPTPEWATILVVIGFGHGAVLNAQGFATQAMCKRGDETLAAAMYAFTRQFGMALGVGIGGSAFQNAMRLKLQEMDLPTDIARDGEAYATELHKLPDESALKAQILEAYVFGFRGVYLFFTCVSGLALLLALLIRHFDMEREAESQQRTQRWG
ncbi:major facilitator superfamily transporter [Thelonectria olida]|uniref:Major facilitator superfamily transporter n=1 Tax=Thelonectria olida TaxID=1576542 RepID=A0A9P8VXV5_9HYPO|nr:major facilitator superfamily transporter [Thelonectria olida]